MKSVSRCKVVFSQQAKHQTPIRPDANTAKSTIVEDRRYAEFTDYLNNQIDGEDLRSIFPTDKKRTVLTARRLIENYQEQKRLKEQIDSWSFSDMPDIDLGH